MISVEGLTVEFGGFTLFDDISFVVNKKDRIALVGKNGAGKSTMLKIFAGLQSPTSGTVSVPKDVTIGYLPQHMQLVDTRTVREEAECAFEHIHEMEEEINRLNTQLAERTDYDSESYQKLIDRVTYLSEHFQMMGGNNYHAELERTLVGLGFSRSDFDRPTSEFSGGWRMRIELAKLLLRQPDVLLLDEPTNHLDIESIQWLENFIATRANAVILVSHDRAFIDNTTFRTLEIELGKVYDYKVKYSEYVVLRQERREQQQRAYENQQKKLADTEAFIERFRYKATKSVQVQSRIKQLEKVERIELAKLLLRQPDVLLLDEPTNHLDIESIQWLENFIATRANAVILVSHDRAFIDNTTFRTLEIELGKVYDYKVKYSEYVVLRQERREQQQRAYENQQKKLADTEAFIERFRYKATKSVQVQSRIKQLEKVERIEVDDVDTAMLRLKFPPAPRSGSYPVICEEVAKRYGDHLIFDHVTLTINRGDKVAFVGKNGEGKSTLVKCIMGEIADFTGKLQLGHNVKIGYFAQNQAQLLNENLTVFDTIDYVAQGDIRLKIRDILGAFMFGGEASDKKVKVLSGGERTRLAMIRLLLEPVNLLILDEPTNHLDMRSKDVLKDALREFDGTVILVSHDREFLDGLVDKVYEFGNQKVVEYLGGIYNFLEHKKMDSLRELERSTGTSTSTSGTGEAQVSQNKLSYEARKELSKAIKKAEKAVAEAEARISELENGIAVIEAKLATPEGASDASLYGEYSALKKELSDAMDLWTERTMELEELNTQDS